MGNGSGSSDADVFTEHTSPQGECVDKGGAADGPTGSPGGAAVDGLNRQAKDRQTGSPGARSPQTCEAHDFYHPGQPPTREERQEAIARALPSLRQNLLSRLGDKVKDVRIERGGRPDAPYYTIHATVPDVRVVVFYPGAAIPTTREVTLGTLDGTTGKYFSPRNGNADPTMGPLEILGLVRGAVGLLRAGLRYAARSAARGRVRGIGSAVDDEVRGLARGVADDARAAASSASRRLSKAEDVVARLPAAGRSPRAADPSRGAVASSKSSPDAADPVWVSPRGKYHDARSVFFEQVPANPSKFRNWRRMTRAEAKAEGHVRAGSDIEKIDNLPRRAPEARQPRSLDDQLKSTRERIADSQVRAAKARDQVDASEWNRIRVRETGDIYRQLERREILELQRALPEHDLYRNVEILGVRNPKTGRITPLEHGRHPDFAAVQDGRVLLGELKSASEARRSVEGGLSRADGSWGAYRDTSRLGQQIQAERSAIEAARKVEGTIVIRGRNVRTGRLRRIEVAPDKLRMSGVSTYGNVSINN